jgi:quercetin dioxygenase-like cupin family protein
MNIVEPKFSVLQGLTQLNVYHANKGEGLPKHEHSYEHLTMVHAGRLIVRKDGRELVMTKETQPVNLLANEWHELEALEDQTVFVNVFSQVKS